MTLTEAIAWVKEAPQSQYFGIEQEQIIKWLTELQAYKEKEASMYRIEHPECLHQCRNRRTRIICSHCTRNSFAPSGENKQDFFNQEVDLSIFERKNKKKSSH